MRVRFLRFVFPLLRYVGIRVGLASCLLACSPWASGAERAPGQRELTIPSHGSRLNGFIYTAAGSGTHPLVIFLHGYPGNERNLDLAQAVRRNGWDALYFDYRGSWGSGGEFGFGHALEDVAAALAFVRAPANSAKYAIDPTHIVLVGHSMGGGLALLSAAADPAVRCTAALAGWNFGGEAKSWPTDAKRRQATADYFQLTTDPASGPIHARAADLMAELSAHAAEWDLLGQIDRLKERRLLLVSDTDEARDLATYRALLNGLHIAGATHLRAATYADDHPFSAHRQELEKLLLGWLNSDCK